MALAAGDKLGPYEIITPIDAWHSHSRKGLIGHCYPAFFHKFLGGRRFLAAKTLPSKNRIDPEKHALPDNFAIAGHPVATPCKRRSRV